MSGDLTLFKYFESYCQIKSKVYTDPKLKNCGPFDVFEFVIYTSARMGINSALQAGHSDPLNFKRRIKSRLPFAGIIRSSPYSPRFQDKG